MKLNELMRNYEDSLNEQYREAIFSTLGNLGIYRDSIEEWMDAFHKNISNFGGLRPSSTVVNPNVFKDLQGLSSHKK